MRAAYAISGSPSRPHIAATASPPTPRTTGRRSPNCNGLPTGREIVYVRGEGANGAGEYPNPTSDPKGAEQAGLGVSLEGAPAQKAPRLIGEGNQTGCIAERRARGFRAQRSGVVGAARRPA